MNNISHPVLVTRRHPPNSTFYRPNLTRGGSLLLRNLLPRDLYLLRQRLILQTKRLRNMRTMYRVRKVRTKFKIRFRGPYLQIRRSILNSLSLVRRAELLRGLLQVRLLIRRTMATRRTTRVGIRRPPQNRGNFLIKITRITRSLNGTLRALNKQRLIHDLYRTTSTRAHPTSRVLIMMFRRLTRRKLIRNFKRRLLPKFLVRRHSRIYRLSTLNRIRLNAMGRRKRTSKRVPRRPSSLFPLFLLLLRFLRRIVVLFNTLPLKLIKSLIHLFMFLTHRPLVVSISFNFLFNNFLLTRLIQRNVRRLRVILIRSSTNILFMSQFVIGTTLSNSVRHRALSLPRRSKSAMYDRLNTIRYGRQTRIRGLTRYHPILLLINSAPLNGTISLEGRIRNAIQNGIGSMTTFLLLTIRRSYQLRPRSNLRVTKHDHTYQPNRRRRDHPLQRHRTNNRLTTKGNGNMTIHLSSLFCRYRNIIMKRFNVTIAYGIDGFVHAGRQIIFRRSTRNADFFRTQGRPRNVPRRLPMLQHKMKMITLQILQEGRIRGTTRVNLISGVARLYTDQREAGVSYEITHPRPRGLNGIRHRLRNLMTMKNKRAFPGIRNRSTGFQRIHVKIVITKIRNIPLPLTLLLRSMIPYMSIVLMLLRRIMQYTKRLRGLKDLTILFHFRRELRLLPSLNLNTLINFVMGRRVPIRVRGNIVLIGLSIYPLETTRILRKNGMGGHLTKVLMNYRIYVITYVRYHVMGKQVHVRAIFFRRDAIISFTGGRIGVITPTVFRRQTINSRGRLLMTDFFSRHVNHSHLTRARLTIPRRQIFLTRRPRHLVSTIRLLVPRNGNSLFKHDESDLQRGTSLPLALFNDNRDHTTLFCHLGHAGNGKRQRLGPFTILVKVKRLPNQGTEVMRRIVSVIVVRRFHVNHAVQRNSNSTYRLNVLRIVFGRHHLNVLISTIADDAVRLHAIKQGLFMTIRTIGVYLSSLPMTLILNVIGHGSMGRPVQRN